MRDSYERFFSEFHITKEQFFNFGLEETIYASLEDAKASWEKLKEQIHTNQPVYMRGFGRNGSSTHLYQEFYKNVLNNENVQRDTTNNAKPTNVIRDLTRYSKIENDEHKLIRNYQVSQLASSIEGPCVLALDALWGAGKTTFLNIWEQYLRDEGFTVVKFNAWETDFSGDPFEALCTEMTTSLDKLSAMEDTKLSEKVANVKNSSQMVIQYVISGAVRNMTAGMIDINQMSTAIAEQSAEPQRFVEYREAKKALEDFKGKLEELACTLGKTDRRPLIVMIDELDRCRPTCTDSRSRSFA